MTQSKLIEASYFDPAAQVRLTVYADTIITDRTPQEGEIITAIRFGGYPEGVSFSILLMNVATPLIESLTVPKSFGNKGGAAR